MDQVAVKFPDGSVRRYQRGTTLEAIARDGGPRDVLAARVDGVARDLGARLEGDAAVEWLTFDDPGGREIYWHSTAHLLAQAVRELFPQAKLAIGPPIEDGFYYDFDIGRPFTPDDLERIEARMRELARRNEAIERIAVRRDEAARAFREAGEKYKAELLEGIPDDPVSFYRQDGFQDMCRGPHLPATGRIGAVKLLSTSGAYWRGDEHREMLQRIYGISFPDERQLAEHLRLLEEAKKRDHRRLGPELELFMFHRTAPGMPYWLPKGLVVLNELIHFWRVEHTQRGYHEIKSPLINKQELYETSGHWEHFREHMYLAETDEGEVYGLKPMNCPNAMIVFGSKVRSYRDLPLRLSDTDTLHRYERSGTLNGLLRVREFTQDDAHIFVTEDQIKSEYHELFQIVERFYSIFGLSYAFRLGTRPEKFMGDVRVWDRAEQQLLDILKESGRDFTVLRGDGAFYGPKVDILMKDALGRQWQMGTLQLDFQLPLRFDLKYTGSDGKERPPVVIHRVIYGSLERFVGILTEHTAGAFPLWLAPEQVRVIPIADRHLAYAERVASALQGRGIRVHIDRSSERTGHKIRDAQVMKVPYMLVVGDREEQQEKVAVRSRATGDEGGHPLPEFIDRLSEEISARR